MYDDRNECYDQYVAAVALATRWQENYDIKVRQLEQVQAMADNRQEVLDMTDAEFIKFKKQVDKLTKANNRNRAVIWALVGYGTVTTAATAILIGLK